MSKKQILIIKKYINEMFDKNYIRFNISSYTTFILIMKKPDKKLRFYIDYKVFNILIIFNRNILLLIKKILIKLYVIKIYNKFNIIIIFNEI